MLWGWSWEAWVMTAELAVILGLLPHALWPGHSLFGSEKNKESRKEQSK